MAADPEYRRAMELLTVLAKDIRELKVTQALLVSMLKLAPADQDLDRPLIVGRPWFAAPRRRGICWTMAGETESILQHLRAIDGKLDSVAKDVREIKIEVGILEHHYASVTTRIDNIDARLERIERRTDLVETL